MCTCQNGELIVAIDGILTFLVYAFMFDIVNRLNHEETMVSYAWFMVGEMGRKVAPEF